MSRDIILSLLLFQAFIPRVLVMYLIAALALIFYVSKVPERYFPGRWICGGYRRNGHIFCPTLNQRSCVPAGQLNYLGSSHQLWHLLLVLMFYWWHQASGFIMAYRHSQPCPGAPQHT